MQTPYLNIVNSARYFCGLVRASLAVCEEGLKVDPVNKDMIKIKAEVREGSMYHPTRRTAQHIWFVYVFCFRSATKVTQNVGVLRESRHGQPTQRVCYIGRTSLSGQVALFMQRVALCKKPRTTS